MNRSQGRLFSDSNSMSSAASDVTSKETTASNTWNDTRSDITLQCHQQNSNLDQLNTQSRGNDRPSAPVTISTSVNTVTNNTTDMQKSNHTSSNEINTQNQQQQNTWMNRDFDLNWKSNTTATQSAANKLNNSTDIEHSPSNCIQQLISGSILINDQGEIDDLSWKHGTHLNSNTSNNSFNPGGEFVTDDSGGSGGYLAPTHIQRRIVASSPELTAYPENHFAYKRSPSSSDASTQSQATLERHQTVPGKTNNNIQPWINPYWSKASRTNTQFRQKDDASQNGQSPFLNDARHNSSPDHCLRKNSREKFAPSTEAERLQISATSMQENQQWENPYWKNWKPRPSAESEKGEQQWKNPYWKDWKPQTPETPLNGEQQWKNPYWKDWKPQTLETPLNGEQQWKNPYAKDWQSQDSTISNREQDKTCQNSLWKDESVFNQDKNGAKLNKAFSFEYKVPPIPPFYECVCTRYASSLPPLSSTNIKNTNQLSTELSNQEVNDVEESPYTIDGQNIAHYRSASSESNDIDKSTALSTHSQFPTLLSETQSPILSSKKGSIVPFSPVTSSALSSRSNETISPLFTNLSNNALSSFDHYSRSTSAVIFTEADLKSIQQAFHLLEISPDAIPVLENSKQVSSLNISLPKNPPSFSASSLPTNSKQQSQPPLLESMSSISQDTQPNCSGCETTSNIQQSPLPSMPNHPSNSNSQQPTLFPVRNSLSNSNSEQSPLFSALNYPSNSSSSLQQSPLFSRPSYSSNPEELLHPLLKQGSIILI